MDFSIHAALVLNRFLQEAVVTLVWGLLFYPTLCLVGQISDKILKQLSRLISTLVIIFFLSVLTDLPINSAMTGDGWQDALSPALLYAVITDTSFGTSWLICLAGSVLLVSALFLSPSRQIRSFFLLSGSGLALAGFSFTGHTQINEGWRGSLHQISDISHVLAGASWVGGLLFLYLLLKECNKKPHNIEFAIQAVKRFSFLGLISVVVIIASGVINTLLILDQLPFGLQNAYQDILSGKIVLVLVMLCLAFRNKVHLTPKLGQSDQSFVLLQKATFIEFILGIVVISCVAILGTLDPMAGS